MAGPFAHNVPSRTCCPSESGKVISASFSLNDGRIRDDSQGKAAAAYYDSSIALMLATTSTARS
jgi:hypothetical protein